MANNNPNMSGLKPAKKGEVRNPTGKNQYTTFRDLAMKHLEANDFDDLFQIARKQAMKGDYRFWADLMDRVFGKAQNNHNITGDITINIDQDDAEL